MSKAERSAHAKKAKKTPKQPKAWDLPESPPKGDDKPDELFKAVGKALSNWEHLENQLANLFATFVGAKVTRSTPAPSTRAYGSIIGFAARAGMLEAAAKAYFLSRPSLGQRERWPGLIEEIKGFSVRRNDIAHGSVELLFDLDAEISLGFYLQPGLYVSKKNPTGEPPAYRLTASQVLYFAEGFSNLADSVRFYRAALETKRRSSPRKPA